MYRETGNGAYPRITARRSRTIRPNEYSYYHGCKRVPNHGLAVAASPSVSDHVNRS